MMKKEASHDCAEEPTTSFFGRLYRLSPLQSFLLKDKCCILHIFNLTSQECDSLPTIMSLTYAQLSMLATRANIHSI